MCRQSEEERVHKTRNRRADLGHADAHQLLQDLLLVEAVLRHPKRSRGNGGRLASTHRRLAGPEGRTTRARGRARRAEKHGDRGPRESSIGDEGMEIRTRANIAPKNFGKHNHQTLAYQQPWRQQQHQNQQQQQQTAAAAAAAISKQTQFAHEHNRPTGSCR